MKRAFALVVSALLWSAAVPAQVPVTPNPDQQSMLASKDPRLARNKRLVYDWLREVFEAGHMDLAEKYMAEGYIQHNPMVPTGRKAFVEHFSKMRAPKSIEPRANSPLVAIVAEGDLVVTAIRGELPDPQNPGKTYTTTWFDMFRIENGKIAEHWDGAMKRPPGAPGAMPGTGPAKPPGSGPSPAGGPVEPKP